MHNFLMNSAKQLFLHNLFRIFIKFNNDNNNNNKYTIKFCFLDFLIKIYFFEKNKTIMKAKRKNN